MHLRGRHTLLILLIVLTSAAVFAKEKPPVLHRIPLPPRADFSELDWLIGEWTGKTLEKSPQGEISLGVSFDLDKRVMIFREQVSLSATPTQPGSRESSMGILSADRVRGFILRVFSDTGFITRYRVAVDGAEVSMSPEGGEQPPPGWLFRRSLKRVDIGVLVETVQVAPPGKPFFEYYSAKLTRTVPPALLPPPAAAEPETK